MVQKAIIEVLEGNPPQKEIEVLFNPNSYTLNEGNSFQFETNLHGLPIAQFTGRNKPTLTMDLFFDSYFDGENADVRKTTKLITELLLPDKQLNRPPLIKFRWGSMEFKGLLVSANQSYTMFSALGNPVRARITVTFEGAEGFEKQEQKSGGATTKQTKQTVAKQGVQLCQLARESYGDSGGWRIIADANKIDNPRKGKPGQTVTVPAKTNTGKGKGKR